MTNLCSPTDSYHSQLENKVTVSHTELFAEPESWWKFILPLLCLHPMFIDALTTTLSTKTNNLLSEFCVRGTRLKVDGWRASEPATTVGACLPLDPHAHKGLKRGETSDRTHASHTQPRLRFLYIYTQRGACAHTHGHRQWTLY